MCFCASFDWFIRSPKDNAIHFLLLTYLFTSGSTSPVDGIIPVNKLGNLFRDFLLEALVVWEIYLSAISADNPKAPHVLERRVPVDLQHKRST